jgi:hypothetical protein
MPSTTLITKIDKLQIFKDVGKHQFLQHIVTYYLGRVWGNESNLATLVTETEVGSHTQFNFISKLFK